MACSTADLPSSVAHNSPGNSSCSDDDDDVPLSKLRTKPRSEEKQSRGNTHRSNTNSEKDKSVSDDSSDDEPLIKKKTIPATAKKPEKKHNKTTRSNGTNNKKADMNSDDSSDNEPLIKVPSKAAKKPLSVSPKKSVDSKKKESLEDGDSSDDVTLSELGKKLYPKRQRKAPVLKSKRNAARKGVVKYAESSSPSSDDEPLATMKRKLTKAPKEQKTSANSKKTKPKDSSSDDDVPLANLEKKKPVIKNTKTTASPGRASRKRRGDSDESSDDEPLINLVKKNRTDKQTKNKPKASPPKKKRNTTPKKPRKMPVQESPSNSSDDEPLIKAAKHPQVTKILNIVLERCDGEEHGDTGSPTKPEQRRRSMKGPRGTSRRPLRNHQNRNKQQQRFLVTFHLDEEVQTT